MEFQFSKMSSPKFSPELHRYHEEKDRENEKEEKPPLKEEENGVQKESVTEILEGREEKDKTEKEGKKSSRKDLYVSKKRKGGVGYSMFI